MASIFAPVCASAAVSHMIGSEMNQAPKAATLRVAAACHGDRAFDSIRAASTRTALQNSVATSINVRSEPREGSAA